MPLTCSGAVCRKLWSGESGSGLASAHERWHSFEHTPVHPPVWLKRARDRVVLGYVTVHGACAQIAQALEFMLVRLGHNYWMVG